MHNDIVPRMPGLPDFWLPAMKDALKALVRLGFAEKGSHLQRALKWKLLFGDGRVEIMLDLLEKRAEYALDAIRGYQHTCKLLMVPLYSDDSQDIVQMDHEEFSSILYGKEGDDELRKVEAEAFWQMHICLPRNLARTYGFFRLKHGCGKCLALGKELYLAEGWGENPDELFWKRSHVQIYVRPPDGTFRLRSKVTDRWLTARGNSLEMSEGDCDEQYFRLRLGKDGYLIESYASGKLVTVHAEKLQLSARDCPGDHHWRILQKKRISMTQSGKMA
ncbi:unnamed protein product [Effrenium voratum]|nr:unnamed protein product [Effrenium voratum]